MPKFYCKCTICGIDFISHKAQRTLCNKCSTNGEDIKEIICKKKCGKTFIVNRSKIDGGGFNKRILS